MGQLLTVQCCSPKSNSKKQILRNMKLSESRKSDNFGESSAFQGIPVGNFRDRIDSRGFLSGGPDPDRTSPIILLNSGT